MTGLIPVKITVGNTIGSLFIGTVLSSIIYGVTWLQVYSYFISHCSRDRWPLRSFVAFLMLVDTLNMAFVCHMTYYGVTTLGVFQTIALTPWSVPAVVFSSTVLEVSVQHFYAYRIYRLNRGSPYLPAAISVISLAAFAIGLVYGVKVLEYIRDGHSFKDFVLFISTLSCDVMCDVLITFGMVYTLLSNRTQVRRTNNVLRLLAIYAINCGALNLVTGIICTILYAKYRDTLLYTPPSLIMTRLYCCAFMAILNSRDNLREALDEQGGVVSTLSHFKARTGISAPGGVQVMTESSTNADVPKSLSPAKRSSDGSSDRSYSDIVIAFDKEKYPIPPVACAHTTTLDAASANVTPMATP